MNSSVLLGDYFDNFIDSQIQSGRFASANEVLRAALRLFEQEENKKNNLLDELQKGEASGFIDNFDRASFLQNFHTKHVADEV